MSGTILALAGTAEARAFAERYVEQSSRTSPRLIASLAGVTREPLAYPCETRSGGFGGIDAMARWMEGEGVSVVLDASHPFAEQISQNAQVAAARVGARYAMLRRPAWALQDHWRVFADLGALALALPVGARVLLTTGRGETDAFAAREDVSFLLRSIEPVEGLPGHIDPVLGRPPFTVDGEVTLMRGAGVTHLVTKNSGGARPAKLDAADALGVEIWTVAMSAVPRDVKALESVEAALEWVEKAGTDC